MQEVESRGRFNVLRNAKKTIELPFINKGRLLTLTLLVSVFSLPFFYSLQIGQYNSENWPKTLFIGFVFYVACVPLLIDAAFRGIRRVNKSSVYPSPLTFGAAISMGIRRLPTIFGVMCLLLILIVGGLIALVVPGVFAMAVTFVAIPASVSENTGVLESVKRSAQLTYGYRWKILGFISLLFIGTQLIDFLVGLSADEAANPVYGALIRWIGASVISAFFTAAQALAYIELKQIQESAALLIAEETSSEVIAPSFSS
jgi:hypothetical protein